jgi:uncharacterized protein (DUF2062 family)
MPVFWRGTIKRLRDLCRLDDPPWKIALGLAVGVFISCTPFYGLHTLMAIGAAFALRVNKLSTVTGAWLNLPWFAPFVYGLSLKVGEFVLSGGKGLKGLREKSLFDLSDAISPYLSVWNAGEGFLASSKLLFTVSKPLFVGTTVVGLVAGAITFGVALWAINRARRHNG